MNQETDESLATRFVMEFYNIDEETAVRLYSDEIEAALRLLRHEEFREYMGR